jgi:hypothetical protein
MNESLFAGHDNMLEKRQRRLRLGQRPSRLQMGGEVSQCQRIEIGTVLYCTMRSFLFFSFLQYLA